MGFGIWPILEPTGIPVTLESLEGKRVAIDVSLWLHQAAQGYSAHNLNSRNPHLALLIHRIAKLLYYKIRPVFVFDGERVPVFKQQLLRERRLKRDVDDLHANDARKIVQEAVRDLNDSNSRDSYSQSPKKRLNGRSAGEDDMFMLPISSKMDATRKSPESDSEVYVSDDFLQGYEQLKSKDARMAFLMDAKERARQARLTDKQIPKEDQNFSDFQVQRLLKRNQINEQLDALKKEQMERYLKVSDDCLKTVVVDSRLRSHVLTKDDEILMLNRDQNKNKLKDSLTWPQFLKQMKEEYEGSAQESQDKLEPMRAFHQSFILDPNAAKIGNRNEKIKLEPSGSRVDSEDDDMQEAILASLQEQQGLTSKTFRNLPESGFSKTDLVDNMTRMFEKRKHDLHQYSWTDENSSSSSDDGFIDVPNEEEDSRDTFHMPKVSTAIKRKDVRHIQVESLPSTSKSTPEFEYGLHSESREIEHPLEADEEYYPRRKLGDGLDRRLELEEEREGIYADCQQLLAFLGLPYMTAPGEAEAQCVTLESLGLVDAIITDDSDVWIFGGKCVYKNMFSHKKNVHRFLLATIKDQLGLDRLEFIQLAMLSGGDYTRGLEKVGVVTALELLVEFSNKSKAEGQNDEEKAFENLQRIKEWLLAKRKFYEENKHSPSKHFYENPQRIKLRRLIEGHNDWSTIERFPSHDIFEAYSHPLVDTTDQRFKWERVKFDDLEAFLWNNLGWNKEKLEKDTHSAFIKWDKFMEQTTQQYQTRITAFAQQYHLGKSADEQKLEPSSRVKAALDRLFKVKGLSKTADPPEPSLICKSTLVDQQKPSTSNKKPSRTRKHPSKLKNPPKPLATPTTIDEDDFYDEETDRIIGEATLQALGRPVVPTIERPGPATSTDVKEPVKKLPKVGKTTRKRKRSVPVRQAKKKAAVLNLSEGSSEDEK